MTGDPKQKNEGEGNKTAARHYNEKTEAFASDKDRVAKAAEEAKQARSGPEKEALDQAEKTGLGKAKH
jgi:hypothetical protein